MKKKKQNKSDQIEELFKSINIGHNNLIKPPKELEKEFSDLIDKKNLSGDLIINNGDGYYRPNPFDKIDDSEFNKYISDELDRASRIIEKCFLMNNRYKLITEFIINKWEE